MLYSFLCDLYFNFVYTNCIQLISNDLNFKLIRIGNLSVIEAFMAS